MSSLYYLASDIPMKAVENPHYKTLSVNEALKMGIENIPEFMLTSDFDKDKPGVVLWSDIVMELDTESNNVHIDDFDDDWAVIPWNDGIFCEVKTEKSCKMQLEWGSYSDGRARQLIDYIKQCLEETDEIELWHLWLDDESYLLPKKRTVSAAELVPEDIRRLAEYAAHAEPCRQYCLVIKR